MPTSELGRAQRVVVVLVAVAVLVGGGGWLLFRSGVGPLPDPEGCSAEVDGSTVDLTAEQAENASLIAAVGVRRGLPARAVSIALATAFQESKLSNLENGDRDSIGLFQQRPSMGWGTPEQIRDPYYATNAFYDALVEVDGYESMRITVAAQTVQRSGFPEAYADHAAAARALASALTGYSPGRFSCVSRPSRFDEPEPETEQENGLTRRANTVRSALEQAFGPQPLGGFEPGQVSTGRGTSPAHDDGRAIDVSVRPATEVNRRLGWAMAQYLVANADRLEIDNVVFDARIWSAGARSEDGWRNYDPGGRRQLRDRVHVEVLKGGK